MKPKKLQFHEYAEEVWRASSSHWEYRLCPWGTMWKAEVRYVSGHGSQAMQLLTDSAPTLMNAIRVANKHHVEMVNEVLEDSAKRRYGIELKFEQAKNNNKYFSAENKSCTCQVYEQSGQIYAVFKSWIGRLFDDIESPQPVFHEVNSFEEGFEWVQEKYEELAKQIFDKLMKELDLD